MIIHALTSLEPDALIRIPWAQCAHSHSEASECEHSHPQGPMQAFVLTETDASIHIPRVQCEHEFASDDSTFRSLLL